MHQFVYGPINASWTVWVHYFHNCRILPAIIFCNILYNKNLKILWNDSFWSLVFINSASWPRSPLTLTFIFKPASSFDDFEKFNDFENFAIKGAHWTGFEPAREDPKWFLITRLNHSAISAWRPFPENYYKIDTLNQILETQGIRQNALWQTLCDKCHKCD